MSYLLKGGTIVTEAGMKELDLLIKNNEIVDIGNSIISDAETIDCTGKYILPGVIDIGGSFGDNPQETSKLAAKSGITTMFDYSDSNRKIVDQESLENAKSDFSDLKINYGFYGLGNKNNFIDLKELDEIIGVKLFFGGFSDDYLVSEEDLDVFCREKWVLVIHNEDESLAKKKLAEFGDIDDPELLSVIRGPEVSFSATKKIVAKDKFCEAKLHLAHVTTKEELLFIEQAGNHNVTSGAGLPYFLYTNANYANMGDDLEILPPVRSKEDLSSLWDDGVALGGLNLIMSYSSLTRPSLPQIDKFLPTLLNSVRDNKVTLPRLVHLTSTQPARIFGIEKRGYLRTKMLADIVVTDLQNISYTFVNGEMVWNGVSVLDANEGELISNNL